MTTKIRTWFFLLAFLGAGCRRHVMSSSAMVPTIQPGQRLEIDYTAYRRAPIKRWDVVAFSPPGRANELWISRVLALPNEIIDVKSNSITVNGVPLPVPAGVPNKYDAEPTPTREVPMVSLPYTVTAGGYFLLGDNRAAALDSRFLGEIPNSCIVGKVRIK